MKLRSLIEVFFELDFEDDGINYYHRKNDSQVLIMDGRHDIPCILTNAEVHPANDYDGEGIAILVFGADREQDPVINSNDWDDTAEVEIYKKDSVVTEFVVTEKGEIDPSTISRKITLTLDEMWLISADLQSRKAALNRAQDAGYYADNPDALKEIEHDLQLIESVNSKFVNSWF